MSKIEVFLMYAIFLLPNIVIMIMDVSDRIKHKNKNSVRVKFQMVLICFLGNFVAVFGFISNLLEYLFGNSAPLWFIIMMAICYIVLLLSLILMHMERIIYPLESKEILFVARFQRRIIDINTITRINISDEYLDVYIGTDRLRCDNIFLVGAENFEKFVKEYQRTAQRDI